MPTPSNPIPPGLAHGPFSVRAAGQAGISPKRLRREDLVRPFAGVRSTEAPADLRALCAAYRATMSDGEFFSHVTAGVLHGMWLPRELEERRVLDVSVVRPRRAPRDNGVAGHHLVSAPDWS